MTVRSDLASEEQYTAELPGPVITKLGTFIAVIHTYIASVETSAPNST